MGADVLVSFKTQTHDSKVGSKSYHRLEKSYEPAYQEPQLVTRYILEIRSLNGLRLLRQLSDHFHDLRLVVSHNYYSNQLTDLRRLSTNIPALPFIQSTVCGSISFQIQPTHLIITHHRCLELPSILLQLIQRIIRISCAIHQLTHFPVACILKYSPQLISSWRILRNIQLKLGSLNFVLVCVICRLVFRCCL